MSESEVIPKPDTIDKAWLSQMLKRAGHTDVQVERFETQTIGTGQMGQCLRIKMQYSNPNTGAPSSLIAKFPSDDAGSRRAGAAIGLYQKEVAFYRDFRPRLAIETPRSYFADIADNGEDFALLLADLAPAEQGDQLRGCSVELAEKAVLQLVGLHAPTWNHGEILDNPLVRCDQDRLDVEKRAYCRDIDVFVEKFSAVLKPAQCGIFKDVAESNFPLFKPLQGGRSLIHMDYRLDNLMLRSDGFSPEISVVDWQTVITGNPLYDVAYLLATSLTVEDRRAAEHGIVSKYYQNLVSAGVADYSFDDCWLDYRRGALAGFLITVTASVSVKQTERGDQMFTLMADRLSQLAIDIESSALLE